MLCSPLRVATLLLSASASYAAFVTGPSAVAGKSYDFIVVGVSIPSSYCIVSYITQNTGRTWRRCCRKPLIGGLLIQSLINRSWALVRSFCTSCLLRPYRSLRDFSNPFIAIPLAFGDLSPNQPVDWNYSYVPTPYVDGRSIATVSTVHIPLEGLPDH